MRQIILPRIKAIDPDELPNFTRVFDKRIQQWKSWQRNVWDDRTSKDTPLLLRAGDYVSREQKNLIWSTATSMRDIDAQCDAVITSLYAQIEEEEDNG